jgi:hypothetical protein
MGWLERRLIGDELSWWWTPQAEAALNVSGLLQPGKGARTEPWWSR